MKKILYIISDIDKTLAFEWVNDQLNKATTSLSFIIISKRKSNLSGYLKSKGTSVISLEYGSKLSLIRVFFKILAHLANQKPEVVHTHLFYANMLGLTAAKILGIKKRIFTRHHAMVHYNEFPSGLKWDKYLNGIATNIVAVSKNVKNILIDRDGADQNKIKLIHHGFDLNYFNDRKDKLINGLRQKYNIPGDALVVGVISRYIEWKGLQYIIPAFAKVKETLPQSHLILANARGPYISKAKSLLKMLPNKSYTEIEFENDLSSLYRTFNIFLHTPIDSESESFGQTYVEALACGIPSIFTLSGVAPEFITHENNALVVPFKDSEEIYQAVIRLLNDHSLAERLIQSGKTTVESFAIKIMIDKLEALYHE